MRTGFDYFGVNSTVLGLSTEDYLMRSIDGLFLPLTVVATTGLAVLWAVRLLQTRLVNGPRPIVTRLFIIGMGAIGAILFGTGMLKVMGWATFEFYPGVVPLCMAAGVLLLLYASRIHGKTAATRRKLACGI
jgi:hypothetical protein